MKLEVVTGELAGPDPAVIVQASDEFAGALFTRDERVNGEPSASNRLDGAPRICTRGRGDNDRDRSLARRRRRRRMPSSSRCRCPASLVRKRSSLSCRSPPCARSGEGRSPRVGRAAGRAQGDGRLQRVCDRAGDWVPPWAMPAVRGVPTISVVVTDREMPSSSVTVNVTS